MAINPDSPYCMTLGNENWETIKTVYDGNNTHSYTIHFDAGTASTDTIWQDMSSATVASNYYYQPTISTTTNDVWSVPSYENVIIHDNVFRSQTSTGIGINWPVPSKSVLKQYRKEQRQVKKAQKKADRLIRGWLSEAEYNYLQEHKELEIPSKLEEETIYIVKRDPFKKVSKKVKGIEKEQLCIVSMNSGFCNDDIFLSKILLLKTDEERFNTVARKYPVAPTPTTV